MVGYSINTLRLLDQSDQKMSFGACIVANGAFAFDSGNANDQFATIHAPNGILEDLWWCSYLLIYML